MKQNTSAVNPGFRVKHKFKLETFTSTQARDIHAEVAPFSDMESFNLDPTAGTITLAYDGSQHQIDEFLAIAESHGVRLENSWWTRLKLNIARQEDRNVKDNAASVPSCCSGKSSICCKNMTT